MQRNKEQEEQARLVYEAETAKKSQKLLRAFSTTVWACVCMCGCARVWVCVCVCVCVWKRERACVHVSMCVCMCNARGITVYLCVRDNGLKTKSHARFRAFSLCVCREPYCACVMLCECHEVHDTREESFAYFLFVCVVNLIASPLHFPFPSSLSLSFSVSRIISFSHTKKCVAP